MPRLTCESTEATAVGVPRHALSVAGWSLLLLGACSVDARAPGVLVAGGGAGAGGAGAGAVGGSPGVAGAGGAAGGAGGVSGSGGAPDGSSGAGGQAPDGGASGRGCGARGDACCDDGARCDAGLGCDEAAGVCAPCAAFRGVGVLDGFTSSVAQGLSGDGRVVVGYAEDDGGSSMAFRLDLAGGGAALPLGVLPGGASSTARAASHDGYAVVGDSDSEAGTRGFRWVDGTLTDLGTWASGDLASHAVDVSADGNAVALTSDGSDGGQLAYRWLLGGEKTLVLGMQQARAISADGNILVGDRLGLGNEAVIGGSGGVEPLGALAGDSVAFASALSSDGAVAVGVSGSCGCRGFFWRAGVIDAAGGIERALATSGDGSVIGGSMAAATCSGGRAALWRAGAGTRAVACELLPAGIIPNGWSLASVNAISDDGRVLAGEGTNPGLAAEGWVAVLGPDCREP